MTSKYYGIKYYGPNDLSLAHELQASVEIINSIDLCNANDLDINHVIELFNITKLFDLNTPLTSWTTEEFESYKKKVKQFKHVISTQASMIADNNIEETYNHVSRFYIDDFWLMLDEYKAYKNISPDAFIRFISLPNVHLHNIVKHKDIVNYFNEPLATVFKKDITSAELILKHHLEKTNSNSPIIHLPHSLTSFEKTEIVESYINSENPNPNFLQLIEKSQGNKDFPISSKLKLLAIKRYQKFASEFFNEDNTTKYGAEISFSPDIEYIEVDSSDIFIPKIVFSQKWILDNLDYPTLLNNFIFLFGFSDTHFRSTFPSNPNELSVFEDLVGIKGKKEYPIGIAFSINEMAKTMMTMGYFMQLLQRDIYLEDIIQWFFSTYLVDEFNVTGFRFNPSSRDSSYLEKCRNICAEIESIIKQFTLYVKEGSIDWELIQISSSSESFSSVPSLIHNKYAYINSNHFNNVLNLLLSDQSLIAYTKKYGSKYDTFLDLVKNEKVTMSDFESYQLDSIQALLDEGILHLENDYIKIPADEIFIMQDLYRKKVLRPNYVEHLPFFKKLNNLNYLYFENTLLSKPEQEYFDFALNHHQFSNGYDLRNKYLHGTNDPTNTETHRCDYFRLLKLLIMIVIKLNEEFCRVADNSANQSQTNT